MPSLALLYPVPSLTSPSRLPFLAPTVVPLPFLPPRSLPRPPVLSTCAPSSLGGWGMGVDLTPLKGGGVCEFLGVCYHVTSRDRRAGPELKGGFQGFSSSKEEKGASMQLRTRTMCPMSAGKARQASKLRSTEENKGAMAQPMIGWWSVAGYGTNL